MAIQVSRLCIDKLSALRDIIFVDCPIYQIASLNSVNANSRHLISPVKLLLMHVLNQ